MMWKQTVIVFVVTLSALFSTTDWQKELEALNLSSKITAEGWCRIGIKDHSGIGVPLLCLHSKDDSGCGEYYDLLPANLTYPPEDEGVNVPGTLSDKKWTYRFKLSVEELTTNAELRTLATPKSRETASTHGF